MSTKGFYVYPMENHPPHRGNRLERTLRAEGVNFVDLASKIQYKGKTRINRMTLYNWFKDENLGVDKIIAVAKHVPAVADAFAEIDIESQIMDKKAEKLKSIGTMSIECQKQINYWRTQTFELQRRVMDLQETIIGLKTAS